MPNALIPHVKQDPAAQLSEQELDRRALELNGTGGPVGPPLADLIPDPEQSSERADALLALWTELARARRESLYIGDAGFETDASGNVTKNLYTVPSGYRAKMVRCIVEVASFTPASAATAGAWIAVLEGGSGTANPATFPLGQLRAFAGTQGAGLFLPAMVVDGEHFGPTFRGGRNVFLEIGGSAAALISKGGTCYYEMLLARE